MSQPQSIVESTLNTATSVASAGYKVMEPYVPQTIKDTVVSPTLSYASNVKDSIVENGVLPAAFAVVSDAKNLAFDTASSAKSIAIDTAQSYKNYAVGTATWAINGATTTVTAYTPSPIKDLLTETLSNAKAVRQDPMGTLKPYVPAFVVHTSERTYEIVTENIEQTKETVNATTGYIVSRVNGTVEYVTSIPQVHSVIEQLNSIAAPVLNKIKLGGTSVPAAEAEAEIAPAAK
ncbi:UNVERIFIED_CONTAM: hypothetical protein HDU68_012237 [Siphonaria sp. JEL0065]|nr:hypothetical protein HDU68_012237 [Siphonaria sp. JEL0065]